MSLQQLIFELLRFSMIFPGAAGGRRASLKRKRADQTHTGNEQEGWTGLAQNRAAKRREGGGRVARGSRHRGDGDERRPLMNSLFRVGSARWNDPQIRSAGDRNGTIERDRRERERERERGRHGWREREKKKRLPLLRLLLVLPLLLPQPITTIRAVFLSMVQLS